MMKKMAMILGLSAQTLFGHCSHVHTAIEHSGNAIYGWAATLTMLAILVLWRSLSKRQRESDV